MSESEPHVPIMVEEILSYFSKVHLKTFFEGTLGAGGHARAILHAHPEIEHYIACDKDPEAIAIAKDRLAMWENKITYVQGDFGKLDIYLKERKINKVDGFFLT